MTDVPRTSPERPIIWSPGRPATGSRRRPVDVPIQNFCIFVFPVKNSNRCVKQGLLHLKNTFFIKSSFFCWSEGSPEGPLEFPDVRIFREPSGDVPGMSQAGWVSSRLTSRYARKTQTDQSIPQPFLICLQKNDPQIFKRGSNKSPFLQWVCMSLVQLASNVFYSMEQLEDISFHNKLSLL